MAEKVFTIETEKGKVVNINVRRDKRLKKSSRWHWQGKGEVLLRIPYQLPNRVVERQIDEIAVQLEKQGELAKRRTDPGLHARTEYLNNKYFKGEIEWRAIRWVGNMELSLGSCTNGGTTDGHIRISEKIKAWPQWVVDYVILHELVHRLHNNHSEKFWHTLVQAYPLTERARGFIRGVGFAQGIQFDDGE